MGIPCKTAAGQAELALRQRGLSQRHRTLLFIIDGRRDLEEVIQLGVQAGVPKAYLDELIALGLVVLAAPLQAAVLGEAEPIRESPHEIGGEPDRFEADAGLAGASIAGVAPTVPDGQAATTLSDSTSLGQALSNTELSALDGVHADLAQARQILIDVLRSNAPVAGAMTLLRVRRARDTATLRALLPDVHARLGRAAGAPAVAQALARVDRLLTL